MKTAAPEIMRIQDPAAPTVDVVISTVKSRWMVVLGQSLITISQDQRLGPPCRRYVLNNFAQRGHAELLAQRLNQLYGSDQFVIAEITTP